MRLATVPVSRVFTTDISRNKEIHLKVLIEDDSKIFGSSYIVLSNPQLARPRPISGGSGKTICAGFTPAAAKPALLRVLRNSPLAMPLSGYELIRPEITCKESVLLCFH